MSIFKDDLQTSPHNNGMGISAEFSKFSGWGEKRQNCDKIICLILSEPIGY